MNELVDSKPWWKSLTVRASLVTIVVSALRAFDVVNEHGAAVLAEDLPGLLTSLTGLVSGIGAMYGRFRASTKLTTGTSEPA